MSKQIKFKVKKFIKTAVFLTFCNNFAPVIIFQNKVKEEKSNRLAAFTKRSD